jgi:hypothetical protein
MNSLLEAIATNCDISIFDNEHEVILTSQNNEVYHASVWTYYALYLFMNLVALWHLLTQGPEKTAPIYVAQQHGLFSLHRQIRFYGIPRELPKYCFVSVHHRRTATPLEFHTMFAFLKRFDEVHVAIGLNMSGLRKFGLSWLPTTLFGAIDLRSIQNSEEKHLALVRPMVRAMQSGRSCAIAVFPDIAGSTHWGDRTMSARLGLYEAALALDVPILDLIHFEPTAVRPYSTCFGSLTILDQTSTEQCPVLDSKDAVTQFTHWRKRSKRDIQMLRNLLHSRYMQWIDSFEFVNESCWAHEAHATSPKALETEVRNNMARSLTNQASMGTL